MRIIRMADEFFLDLLFIGINLLTFYVNKDIMLVTQFTDRKDEPMDIGIAIALLVILMNLILYLKDRSKQ